MLKVVELTVDELKDDSFDDDDLVEVFGVWVKVSTVQTVYVAIDSTTGERVRRTVGVKCNNEEYWVGDVQCNNYKEMIRELKNSKKMGLWDR